jgi:hypothetical protein
MVIGGGQPVPKKRKNKNKKKQQQQQFEVVVEPLQLGKGGVAEPPLSP